MAVTLPTKARVKRATALYRKLTAIHEDGESLPVTRALLAISEAFEAEVDLVLNSPLGVPELLEDGTRGHYPMEPLKAWKVAASYWYRNYSEEE